MSHDEFRVTVPASADYLRLLRHLVAQFARGAGAGEDRVLDMMLAVNEGCANVILHAYGEEKGRLHVQGRREVDRLLFEVSDNGTPIAKPAPEAAGGLGIPFIRELADDVEIEGPGPYGTRLELGFRLEGRRA